MSTDSAPLRAGLLAELIELERDSSSLALLIHGKIAEHFGLNPADLKALDLARHEGALTAGRLAEITGLSAPATTALLDRLERRGFVERQRDPRDRRKVHVVVTTRHEAELRKLFEPFGAGSVRAMARYDDTQLTLIVDFLRQTVAGSRQVLSHLEDSLTRPPSVS